MSKKYPGLSHKDAEKLVKIIARQKRERREEKVEMKPMIEAIRGMMQRFGIPKVEFEDLDGTVHGQIVAPKPKNIPCMVPSRSGGLVEIKQGDHIRLWCRDEYTGIWSIEGNSVQREAKGIVLFIGPSGNPGTFDLAYQRDNSEKTEGASSCKLCCPPVRMGWARVVEKLGKEGKKS